MREKIGMIVVILSLVFMVYATFLFAEDYLVNDVDGVEIITDSDHSDYNVTKMGDNVTLFSGDLQGSIVKVGETKMVRVED